MRTYDSPSCVLLALFSNSLRSLVPSNIHHTKTTPIFCRYGLLKTKLAIAFFITGMLLVPAFDGPSAGGHLRQVGWLPAKVPR